MRAASSSVAPIAVWTSDVEPMPRQCKDEVKTSSAVVSPGVEETGLGGARSLVFVKPAGYFLQRLQILNECANLSAGQVPPRHGGLESIALRIDAISHGVSEAGLGEGGLGPAFGILR